MELSLVQVVVDRLAGDRVAETNFGVLLIVNEALTSTVVEGSLTTFGFELGEAKITHFSGALQGHFRIVLGEDLVVLRWDHLILAFNPTEAGEQEVFDC